MVLRTLIPCCLLVLPGCVTRADYEGELVTMFHFVQTGREQVDQYLDETGADELREAIDRAKRACLRVRTTVPSGDETVHLVGSGVLLRGGLVLTAGHLLPERGGATKVTTTAGRAHSAHVVERVLQTGSGGGDWALLRVDTQRALRGLHVSRPQFGEVVAVLGYPHGVGIDAAGRVARDWAGESIPLAPVVALARVVERRPLTLAPVAGSMPVEGAGGSAVIDQTGDVIGTVTSAQPLSRTWLVQHVRVRPRAERTR